MPTYTYACPNCDARFELERDVAARDEPAACPVCATTSRRTVSTPKLLFKGDPADNRPVWHSHDGYSHAHPPRRGRHRTPEEDH